MRGGRGRGSTLIFWAGVSNGTQEPSAFTIPCSAVQLQFYYANEFVICIQQKPTKKPTLYKISAALHGTNTACFKSL